MLEELLLAVVLLSPVRGLSAKEADVGGHKGVVAVYVVDTPCREVSYQPQARLAGQDKTESAFSLPKIEA